VRLAVAVFLVSCGCAPSSSSAGPDASSRDALAGRTLEDARGKDASLEDALIEDAPTRQDVRHHDAHPIVDAAPPDAAGTEGGCAFLYPASCNPIGSYGRCCVGYVCVPDGSPCGPGMGVCSGGSCGNAGAVGQPRRREGGDASPELFESRDPIWWSRHRREANVSSEHEPLPRT
jgi:hypothetical protein